MQGRIRGVLEVMWGSGRSESKGEVSHRLPSAAGSCGSSPWLGSAAPLKRAASLQPPALSPNDPQRYYTHTHTESHSQYPRACKSTISQHTHTDTHRHTHTHTHTHTHN